MMVVRPMLLICFLALAAPALAQKDDRITVSPTLPRTDKEKDGTVIGADPFDLAGLEQGQAIYSTEGVVSAWIEEVVRDQAGKPTRIILTTPDGKNRYAPADDLRFAGGQAVALLSRVEILDLPEVEDDKSG